MQTPLAELDVDAALWRYITYDLHFLWYHLWRGAYHTPCQYHSSWQQHQQSLQALWRELQDLRQKPQQNSHPPGQSFQSDDGKTKKNRHFRDNAWSTLPYFIWLKGYYLSWQQLGRTLIESSSLPPPTQEKLVFFLELILTASAPYHYLAGNPEAIKLAFASEGSSLKQGRENWLTDLPKGKITHSPPNAFQVGKNLVITPGQVIFRNELMELIEYTPQTDQVHTVPLLVVPPCINKYYVLDLRPENSLVLYLVQQGFRVFLISWRNPENVHSDWGWFKYLEDGVWRALTIASEIAPHQSIHTLGFCIGGLLLASALAAASNPPATSEQQQKKPAQPPPSPSCVPPPFRIQSCTLMTTLLDYSNPGSIRAYLPELVQDSESAAPLKLAPNSIPSLISAQQFHAAFASLRPQELIGNFIVSNYLKGKTPPAFDLLHWNSDGTNLPGQFYREYLGHCYLGNQLQIPDQVRLGPVTLNLHRLQCPVYILAAQEDHIVPWPSAYASTQILSSPAIQFTLTSGGHIAGVVNPPGFSASAPQIKRRYWINQTTPRHSQDWYQSAIEHPGSWWPHWIDWLKPLSGELINTTALPSHPYYPALEAAPGQYVFLKPSNN